MNMYSRSLRNLAVILLTVVVFACDKESDFEKQAKEEDFKIQTFLSENDITAERHSSGIYFDALKTNSGGDKVSLGDVVSFYYKLTTLDSTYDEVISDSANLVFTEHSYERIIPSGLYYGLNMMRKGEIYRFFIPSYLAYDSYGEADFFDPFSIFIFDIEVVDIQEKDDINEWEADSIDSYIENNDIQDIESLSSGLHHKILEAGDGNKPSTNSTVKFNYVRKYLDGSGQQKNETNKPIVATLSENAMIKGLVEGISRMKEGEKAMFIVPSKLAYGSSFIVLPREIRPELIEDKVINTSPLPFSPVIYEIELLDVD